MAKFKWVRILHKCPYLLAWKHLKAIGLITRRHQATRVTGADYSTLYCVWVCQCVVLPMAGLGSGSSLHTSQKWNFCNEIAHKEYGWPPVAMSFWVIAATYSSRYMQYLGCRSKYTQNRSTAHAIGGGLVIILLFPELVYPSSMAAFYNMKTF